jgi:tetratricopeptide (TPR) repeat protein
VQQSSLSDQFMKSYFIIILLILFRIHATAQSEDSSRYFYLKASEAQAGRLYMQAYQDYKRSLGFDPKNPDLLRQLGLTEVELRKYEEAIPVFENLLSIVPADTTAITQLTKLYFYTHRWEKTIPYATKALQMHIGEKNYYMIGKSYYELEDYGHAFSYLPSAGMEEPKNAEIPYIIARAYVDMNNYKPSIPYFQKAIALDSNKAQWIYECALVYATIYDDQSAIKYYDLASSKGYKKDNDFYENLADSYISIGKPEKGLQILQEILVKKPADLDLLNSLGFTSYKLKKYDQAIEYWDRILEYDKQNGRALYMIGMSYQKKGDTEKGKALCDKAIALDPSLKNYKQEIRIEQ